MKPPWYLNPRISLNEREGMVTKEENSRSILLHKELCHLHDATLCERVPGSKKKEEENWFLVIQKGLCVLVKVQASLIKHSFGALLFVSQWQTLILYSSVTFAFNLLNFHWLKSRWDVHSLCMCLSVNCRVCCVAPFAPWEFAEDEFTNRLPPWFFLFLQR